MKKTRIVTILICITLLMASIFVLSACEIGDLDPNGDNSDTQTVTVSFVVDGSVLTTKTITSGSDINDLPAVPEKTGYNGAWSVSDLTSISTDITVNAVYTAKTYTLTFDYDGADGNNTQTSKTVTYNQVIGDLPVPTKDGFTFGGWKVDGNTITETTTWNIDGDKTAVASYIAINDGHSILTADGYTFKDKTLTLKNHLSSDTEEYDLRGKFTVSVGSTWRAYSSPDCQPLNENTNRILTLKSGWNVVYIRVENQTNYERSDYELKIYKNSRFTVKYYNGITLMDEESVEEGDCANGITPPDKEYYTFVEWQNNGKSFDVAKTPITENTEIYAKYKANEYKVTFKADGKTVDTKTYTVENKTVVAPSIPEKTGYTAQWETYELNYSDITVNAIYSAIKYKVTFKADGKTVDTKTYTVENKTVVAPSIPVKTGYTAQWESYELNCSNITVNAVYTAKTYTLTFDYDGADGNNTQTSKTVTYNQPIGDLPVPVKTNHKFVKWMNGTTEFTSSTIWNIDTDSKIVAVWDEIYSEGLEFTLNSEGTEYSVSKGTCTDKNVVIPKIYNELPVTSICYRAFNGCSSLTSVTIGNGVTSIGEDAFRYCDSLTSIVIPDSVTRIGDFAFYNCSSLESVTIGNGVTSIGFWAFEYCYKLVEVINKSSLNITKGSENNGYVGYYALNVKTSGDSEIVNKDGYLFYTYDNVNYLLGYVGSETNLTLPDSYNGENYEIYKYAFYNCSSLTSVTIPDSVTSIEDYAFYNCKSLESVTIGNSVESIGDDAFEYCNSLTSVTIGNSVESIGEYAFYYCDSLTSIVIPDSVESIGRYAFYNCKSLESVTIGNSVESIGEYAFYYCDSLTSIVIPDSVESIGRYAFKYCYSLTSVTIGNSVESIGEYAFYYCDSLTSVNYTGTIDEWVQFCGLSNLMCNGSRTKKLYINNELVTEANITTATKINDYAFYNCGSLTSVTIGNSVESIGDDAFEYCNSLTSINYTGTIDEWVQFSELSNLMCKGSFTKKLYINNELVTEAKITTATKINKYAFRGCSSLTSVTIGNSVESIEYEAFYWCRSLTSVTIGDSVNSIGDYAFYGCRKLVEVINKSGLNITKGSDDNGCVGEYALNIKTSGESEIVNKDGYLFYTYNNVNYLLGYVGGETNLTLPDSYNEENYKIYKYAFEYCESLTSVTIGGNVTSIGEYAFYYCYKLVEVINKSSLNITKGSENNGYVGYYALNVKTSGESEIVNKDGYLFYTYNNVNYLFGYVGSETNLTLPDSYNGESYEIYQYAFYCCYSLTSVTIGNSVTSIGSFAFEYCYSLTSVTIGNSVTSIGYSAFEYCPSLTSVTIGNSVTSIGSNAFEYCPWLTSVTIGSSVESIGSCAFKDCYSLTSVTFEQPDGWYVAWDSTATSGTDLDLSNAEQNATYLKSTYYNYYWKRK